jgi:stage III sporulation protein AC
VEGKVDIDLIMKVAGVGMIIAVVCQVLNKAGRDDQSTMVSIAGMVIILLLVVEEMGVLIDTLRRVFGV